MMLLLIEHFLIFSKTNVLVPTDNILKWTNQYKENTDVYLEYINECTET